MSSNLCAWPGGPWCTQWTPMCSIWAPWAPHVGRFWNPRGICVARGRAWIHYSNSLFCGRADHNGGWEWASGQVGHPMSMILHVGRSRPEGNLTPFPQSQIAGSPPWARGATFLIWFSHWSLQSVTIFGSSPMCDLLSLRVEDDINEPA